MTTVKICKDERGFLWAVALPENVENCENGPILGPPEGLRKNVHNRLVEAGIYNAFDLLNNRKTLMEILRDTGMPKRYATTVTHVYQVQYFAKEDEE